MPVDPRPASSRLLVIAYWVFYTRRLKTRPHVGTQEGIAMAIQAKERSRKSGSAV